MGLGLIGKKCGMSRIFTKDGDSIPVTIILTEANRVTQIKNYSTDGYNAIQVTSGVRKSKHLNKPLSGHYAKSNVDAGCGLWEIRLETEEQELTVGSKIALNIFEQGQYVDITGTSKGKGFEGVIKRHNFSSQDASHGNSLSHRAPGSIGQNQSPGRVFKGKKMAGQLGNSRVTVQNLEIIKIDVNKNLLSIKGSIPGSIGSYVIIKPSVKNRTNKPETI